MLGTPVKTLLLRAVKSAIQTIPDIKTVIRSPIVGIDRETAKFPICFMDDLEETKGRRNRIAWNTFPLVLEVWVENTESGEALWDDLDLLEAEINMVLLPETNQDADVNLYSMNIVQLSANKMRVDERTGVNRMTYTVWYAHEWAHPDQTGKSP